MSRGSNAIGRYHAGPLTLSQASESWRYAVADTGQAIAGLQEAGCSPLHVLWMHVLLPKEQMRIDVLTSSVSASPMTEVAVNQ